MERYASGTTTTAASCKQPANWPTASADVAAADEILFASL